MTAQGGGHRADSHKPGRRPTAVRRRGFAAALPFLLLTMAQATPDTLTLAQARALPAEVLARRVLGASGSLVRTAHVSAGAGMFANPYRLASIEFATTPRSAGFPGPCQAHTFVVGFRPVDGEDGQDLKADLPSSVVSLDRTTRFRRVDVEPAPASGWDDAYGKAMDAACARAGPVLREDGSSPFFISLNDGQIDPRGAVASTALTILAAAVKLDPGVPLICQTSVGDSCPRQVADLVKRPPDEVRSALCEKTPGRRCLDVRYDQGWLHWLTLRIESDAGRGATAYWTPPTPIRAVHVEEVHAVE